MFKLKSVALKELFILILLTVSTFSNAQLVFSEPFNETDDATSGFDNIGGVNWNTSCPTCLDAGDFFHVDAGELVGQDSNGPATWETGLIDISSCTFIDISFLLREEGTMEACGTGCTSVDWVQLEYNIDNSGWQTPSNSTFCSGNCAGINVIQSDDISGTNLDYSTGCIASGATIQIRVSIQAWAANERWYLDDVEVNCATGPSIDAGLDQNICGEDVTLIAFNPDNGILSWNNGVPDGINFTPPIGENIYVVYSDLAGCVATDTVVVNVNSQPNFNVSATNPSTCGGTDGLITISGLIPSTLYEITYTSNAIQGPNSFTTDASGDIIISNLSTGTYTDFVVARLGCETTDNTIINLIDPSAPNIDAGNSQFVCDGTEVTLSAINPDNATLNWNNGVTNGVSFTPSLGTVTYTVVAELNGCTAADFVDVTLTQSPDVDATIDIEVCEGSTINLTAINPDLSIITWNNGVIDGVDFIPNVGLSIYTVTANLNGCETIDDINVLVNASPSFLTNGTGPNSCLGSDGLITISGLTPNESYTLGYSNGSLQGPFIMTSDATGNVLLNGLTAGDYTNFTVENLGCISTDNAVVNLIDPVNPTIDAGNSELVCDGTDIILSATNPDNAVLNWDIGVIDGDPFQPGLGVFIYTVTANLNGCTSIDSLVITVVSAPMINAGVDQSICSGDSIALNAINPNGTNIQWNNNVVDGITFAPQTTATYTVTSSIGGCSTQDDVLITVNQGPDSRFTFNPNNPSIENTEVQFNIQNSNSNMETFNWNFGDAQSSALENPIHIYPEVGGISYEVNLLVIDSAGCKDSTTKIITIDDVLLYFVPNAFTPDNDNINNTFQPVFTSGFDPYDYHLIIFNRWGEIVFESYDSQIGWDGTYLNGNVADTGVYVWTIGFGEVTSDKRNTINGLVTLLR